MEDDNQIIDEFDDIDDKNSEDEVEGDDLMENMEKDYEARDDLDHYEAQGIDDLVDANQELSLEGRMQVDR